jgi:hypothetical protein
MQQISTYQSLDTATYIENMIRSFNSQEEMRMKEMENLDLSFNYKWASDDSIRRHYQRLLKERCDKFIEEIYSAKSVYVLNLLVNQDSINKKKIFLEVDNGKLNFNIFDFGKNFKGNLFVFVDEGRYSEHDTHYITFAPKLGRNAPKVFKKIMSKKPKCLLYCYQFEQMNTILYMLNDKIYVYRIAQMEEYEIEEYLKRFESEIVSTCNFLERLKQNNGQ